MKNEKKGLSIIAHPRPVYPWIVRILCNLISFYVFLLQFSPWDLTSNYPRRSLIFSADKGILFTPFALSIILFQIPITLLIDQFGSRKVANLTLIIASLGVILLGYTHTHYLM